VDLWAYEKEAQSRGYMRVVGLDEAGRGPLAGPVVTAAVILPHDFDLKGIGDSKALTPRQREKAFARILAEVKAMGIGVIGPEVIDDINILRATHVAMRAALDDLDAAFDFILVDGLAVPGLPTESMPIVGGDAKSASIGAASIVAKVTRDRIMRELDAEYPQYGFASHKGYCTHDHLRALEEHGPCPCHRRSFAPVAERIANCRLPGFG
jgi:ribonuclease HII